MKRLKLFSGLALLFVAAMFVGTQIASAHSFRSGSSITIGEGEAINQTLFVAAQTLDISSEVFGDIFCAGQTVTITGKVHGDIICAAQTITITGSVDGDIRVAGQTITVGATVAGNATVAGQSFNLQSSASIGGDVSLGSANAAINGVVGRDIASGAETLSISNKVGRNVEAAVTNLELLSGANVGGSVDYTSSNQIKKSTDAFVGGTVTRSEPPKQAEPKRGAVFGFGLGWFLYWFLAMLLVAMTLILLFPRLIHSVTSRGMPRPWKSLLTGFAASFAVPVVMLIAVITVIGIPLALILGLLWFVILVLSGPIFGYYLGRWVLRDSRQPLLIMAVGSSILLVLYFIPLIGFLALLLAGWIGVGMILLELFSRTPKPDYATGANGIRRKDKTSK